jgi:sterol desaturase/sphingolipid hydroxylase (fatty acid hydroxylase superfamily)
MRESAASPRMFKSDFLDFFSRSPWWMVPVMWLPVSITLLWYGYTHNPDLSLGTFSMCAAGGWLAWTFSEYWLHRVVFHWDPDFALGKKFHFMIHGVHHVWPNDRFRLVMPPAANVLLSGPFSAAFFLLLGKVFFFPFFGGYLLGYVQYEITHYAVHHFKWKNRVFKDLKRHHLLHHHSAAFEGKKFGVSSTLWDRVFRTYS